MQASSDVLTFDARYQLTPRLAVYGSGSFMRVSMTMPRTTGPLASEPQDLFYAHGRLGLRVAHGVSLDCCIDYRDQWGSGTPFPFSSYMPGATLSLLLPPRSAAPIRLDDEVRRLTREPLYDERAADDAEVLRRAPPPSTTTPATPPPAENPAPPPAPPGPGVPPCWTGQ